jgi:hypothetical protein
MTYLDNLTLTAIIAGVLFSMPTLPALLRLRELILQRQNDWPTLQSASRLVFGAGAMATFLGLQAAAAVLLIASTYNPFIYYRF